MIYVSFQRGDAGEIVSCKLTGHAASGKYGHDIVCSAVSSLSLNAVNSIEVLAGYQPLIEIDQEEGGHLRFEILNELTNAQAKTTQILLESLLLGLNEIKKEYSEFIKIEILSK